jgi:ACS family hexuronate transporter-like MFS transporter
LSIYGGKIPTIIINKTGLNPYAARMRAMLIFAFFPLLVLLAQPLGTISPWLPVIMIGIGGAAHQSWSANIFSTVGDMFPKSAIASITGIGGMAGGVGSMILQYSAGKLFVHADITQMVFMGFIGKPAGYFIIFCICSVAYLVGWIVMKALVPKYKPIILD